MADQELNKETVEQAIAEIQGWIIESGFSKHSNGARDGKS